jgi:hypothetical protein
MKAELFFFTIIISFISASDILAQTDSTKNDVNYYPKRYYSATRTRSVPKIDGNLNDSCWNLGSWSGGFRQWIPVEGAPPSNPTEIKILYDYGNIYAGFKCYDSESEKMRRIFDSRDRKSGDVIGIAFDSYNDDKTAFEFNLTSAGQKIDVKHIGDNAYDINWNANWVGAAAVSDSGWSAEMKIPLSQLRYINQKYQAWGLYVYRLIDRYQEEDHWQLLPRKASTLVNLFGELDNIIDIKPSRQLEISPYLSLKYIPGNDLTRLPNESYHSLKYGGGLDSKIGVSSNLVLDLTVNPDFGQVEADPSELNLTSYETFYNEKRPFFLEGKEIFDFNMAGTQLFYSRRIGQIPKYNPALQSTERINYPIQTIILGAAKLTGKTSHGLSIGVIESLTGQENATISSEDTLYKKTVAPYTNYYIARVKKEFNKANTTVGGMLTSSNKIIKDRYLTEQLYANSYTGGLDFGHYMKNRTYYLEAKTLFSTINGSKDALLGLEMENVHRFQRPDAKYLYLDTCMMKMTGTAGSLSFGKRAGKWRYEINSSWMSPNLDLNDVGYIRQADLINEGTSLSYVSTVPKGIFRNFTLGADQNASWSFGKELVDFRTRIFFNSLLSNMWNFNTYIKRNFSYYDPRVLRGGAALMNNPYWTFYLNSRTNNAKDLQFQLSYLGNYNEDKLMVLNNVSANLRWLPIRHIRFNSSVSYSDLIQRQQYILKKTPSTNVIYMFGDLRNKIAEFTLRTSVFFTNELSLEYYGSIFLSTGDYSNYKKVLNSHARNYEQRFYTYTDPEISLNSFENYYSVADLEEGQFNFTNPDFRFGQFRSNLVLRWEYKLGSMVYIVWSHDQTNQHLTSQFSQAENLSSLFKTLSRNVLMIKFNYWFTL